jgi:hypothetical protein
MSRNKGKIKSKAKNPATRISLIFIIIVAVLAIITFIKKEYLLRSIRYTNTTVQASLPMGKIAYVKDGEVYTLEGNISKQITQNAHVLTVKWSNDGNILGWIEQIPGNTPQNSSKQQYWPVNISVLYVQTGERKTIVTKGPDINESFIRDFDFSSDGQYIAYIYKGVWLYDLALGNDKKILDDYISEAEPINTERYALIDWNPKDYKLLLTVNKWESNGHKVYDLATKQLQNLSTHSVVQVWDKSGKEIISARQGGYENGGLWVSDANGTNLYEIIGDDTANGGNPKVDIPAISVSGINGSKNILASMENYVEIEKKEQKLPFTQNNIYIVTHDGEISALTNNSNRAIGFYKAVWSPNDEYITYLIGKANDYLDSPKTLHIMRKDGKDDHIVIDNISDYSWAPSSIN